MTMIIATLEDEDHLRIEVQIPVPIPKPEGIYGVDEDVEAIEAQRYTDARQSAALRALETIKRAIQ